MHRSTPGLIALTLLCLGGPAAAQARPVADRVAALESEVAALKRLVAEQGRRIAALEERLAAVRPASGSQAPAPGARPEARALPAPVTPSEAGPRPAPEAPAWARPTSWRKLAVGMSEQQVVAILGKPSATREIGFSRRLIYRGQVPGAGFLKGVVKLQDGKVADIDLPAF